MIELMQLPKRLSAAHDFRILIPKFGVARLEWVR